jgi:tetraprenyl-beta-curcumene synthase
MTRPSTISAAPTLPVTPPGDRGAVEPRAIEPQAQALDRRLATRSVIALALANGRYWSSVAPLVHGQLRRWSECAQAIDDRCLRALAVEKLEHEGFNAEAAAMLATLAPRRHRRAAVEAIVALEVMYDYLDGLTETPSAESPGDGERLYSAFSDAVAPGATCIGDYYAGHAHSEDHYLEALVLGAQRALAQLPAITTVAEILQASAARGAEAQLQIHASSLSGVEPLRRWAQLHAVGTPLQWREFLAGAACSVLGVHALVAAAADGRTTFEQALEIDRIYLSISVLPTVLDGLLDRKLDADGERPGHLSQYEDDATLGRELAGVIGDTIARARRAPHGPHHVMTLAGVVAYYFSAPTADSELARAITERVGCELRPLLAPTLAIMRAWRAGKRLRTLAPSRRRRR